MNWRRILVINLLNRRQRFDSDARCLTLKDTDHYREFLEILGFFIVLTNSIPIYPGIPNNRGTRAFFNIVLQIYDNRGPYNQGPPVLLGKECKTASTNYRRHSRPLTDRSRHLYSLITVGWMEPQKLCKRKSHSEM